jgi:trans-2,3-dihydro-3-hydroxyanthranilate isomerase
MREADDMERDYLLLDVFTDRLFGGNQLAVFPRADGLGAEVMQAIARELNLSETVFVLPAEAGGDYRLRIFTPGMELPFAGHPTIGAAIALAGTAPASMITFEEGAGLVPVSLDASGKGVQAMLTSPKPPEPVAVDLAVEDAAAMLGLGADALASPPSAYSAGVPFLFVPVASLAAFDVVTLDLARWRQHLSATAAPHVVALWMDDWNTGRNVHVRMFAPLMGIAEDPATGAAAAACAGLLVDRQRAEDGTRRWTIHQGHAMGRPSMIHLEADVEGGRPRAVRVGGTAVIVGHGSLRI